MLNGFMFCVNTIRTEPSNTGTGDNLKYLSFETKNAGEPVVFLKAHARSRADCISSLLSRMGAAMLPHPMKPFCTAT